MTFWEHLEELRKVFLRILLMVVLVAMVAFMCKELLFRIILAPSKPDFVFYKGLAALGNWLQMPSLIPADFKVELFSNQLTSQFMIHLSMAFFVSILMAAPYILYQLFRFVSPALYANERTYSTRVVVSSYLLFMLGVSLNYFLIFPLTFRFLGTYQVSPDVPNVITLNSYINTFMTLTLTLGIVFEIPILSWLFAKLGFLTAGFMKHYRKHAVVLVLVVAAFITPTTDMFTLLIVSVPIYLLYEVSILIVKRTRRDAVTAVSR